MRALLAAVALMVAAAKVAVADEMHPLALNGFHLVDAEYLPFQGREFLRYPDDVLFGFYAAGTTEPARACARRAYRELRALFADAPAALRQAVERGATPYFYLWIDDYTGAAPDRAQRPARLWHWDPEGRDYTRGCWKWESVVTQSGACHLPDRDQALAALGRAADALSFVGDK